MDQFSGVRSGGNGGVGQYTNKIVGLQTNCTAGLEKALEVVNASSNGTNIVVFVSDGMCKEAVLFKGDVRFNLKFGQPEAEDEVMFNAAKSREKFETNPRPMYRIKWNTTGSLDRRRKPASTRSKPKNSRVIEIITISDNIIVNNL